MAVVLFVCLLALLVIGAPVAVTLGLSVAVAIVFGSDFQLTQVVTKMFAGVDSFPIMAIPLFLFAGGLMEIGGISERLIKFASELVGHIRAGLVMVTVLACMLFSGISGSGVADTAAVGSITVPRMIKRGYHPDFTTALLASAGALGPIIPPSMIMVVLGVVGSLSIGGLFLGGIIPGILITIGFLLVIQIFAKRTGQTFKEYDSFSLPRLGKAFVQALPALIAPIIILGGILSGVFTATESAAIAVAYSFLVGTLIYRELTWEGFKRIAVETAARTSMVLLIISAANAFAWVVGIENIPQQLANWISSISSSQWMFLLFVNLIFLITGAFMEEIAAILILFPILQPAAEAFGVDPLHFGIVIAINMAVGLVTPPYGITLFTACTISNRPIRKVSLYVLPMVAVMIVVVAIVTYVPELTMWLPNLFFDR